MIACENKSKKLKVIPPYKIVVVRTFILKFLTHWPPEENSQRFQMFVLLFVSPCLNTCTYQYSILPPTNGLWMSSFFDVDKHVLSTTLKTRPN